MLTDKIEEAPSTTVVTSVFQSTLFGVFFGKHSYWETRVGEKKAMAIIEREAYTITVMTLVSMIGLGD